MKRVALFLSLAVMALPTVASAEPWPIHEGIGVDTLQPAERGDQVQLIPPSPPPTTVPAPVVGLWGQPFAPTGLSDCDEMNFYRRQWGLPDAFSGLGWRESNCLNQEDVKTYCCYGYWQLYFSQHQADHRMRPRYEACGIYSIYDYNGDSPLDKQKQACGAKSLFDVEGFRPWKL